MKPITEISIYWFLSSGLVMLIPHVVSSILLPKRSHAAIRIITGIIIYSACAFGISLVPANGFLMISLHHVLSAFYLIWCCKLSWRMYAYYFIWGITFYFLTEQLGAVFASAVDRYNVIPVMYATKLLAILLVTLLEITVLKSIRKKDVESFSWKQILLSALISFLVIAINMVSFTTSSQRTIIIFLFQLFSMLVAVLALYMQVMTTESNRQRSEAELLKLLWRMNKRDYEAKREYVELVNHKYHDLKHELRALRQMDSDGRNERLDQLERSLDEYKNLFRTGNEALDTILNDKRRECENREIVFTCTAQGGNLDFIDLIDLNILLGNLIDNAIEAVFSLPKEQRIIDLKIFTDKQFLRIYEANYYEGELQYAQDGLVSTKVQDGYHGFGTRSMKYIIERYQGEMTIDAQDQVFRLHILIPIPADAAANA